MKERTIISQLVLGAICLLAIGCNTPDAPSITTYSPESGPAETLITVEGTDFVDLQAIDFNEEIAADFNPSFGKETALLFRVPADAIVGDNMVSIVTDHGETSFPFKVTLDAPSVFDFGPKSANVGAEIWITGKNFFEPLEVLFFDSIPGNILYAQEDSLVVEVPPNVQRGRIKVKANGGFSITPELFFSTEEILINDFDGNGIRSETENWIFFGVDETASNAVTNNSPNPIDGNFLKLSGDVDPQTLLLGGTLSNLSPDFDVFGITSDLNSTFIEFQINSNGQEDTHLIIGLNEKDGSPNDFTETIILDGEGWQLVSIPLNRFADITGATPDPQKLKQIKLLLSNDLGSNQKLEANIDNLKFVLIL